MVLVTRLSPIPDEVQASQRHSLALIKNTTFVLSDVQIKGKMLHTQYSLRAELLDGMCPRKSLAE